MRKLSLSEHIEQLRRTIIIYLVILFIFSAVSFVFIEHLISFFTNPLDAPLVFFSPQEGFLFTFKLSILVGFILSIPVLLILLWNYISHALTIEEKKQLKKYFPLSFLLFIVGVSFAYFIITPIALNFLINYGQQYFTAMISVKEYFSFLSLLFLIFGLVFQLPLIILFFNSIGVLPKEQLKEKRRYFYVAAFIIGAFLTPPDVITQIFLALSVIGLYELSYLIVRLRG